MSRGLAIVRAAAAPVAVAGQAARSVGLAIVAMQRSQPSIGAETRAFVRAGREDLLATLMGPLAGVTREPGQPGSPTSYQTTTALERGRVRDIERG
jgi:hypothetical protein